MQVFGKVENGHKNVTAEKQHMSITFLISITKDVQENGFCLTSYPPVLLKVNLIGGTQFSSGILVARKSRNVFSFLISST